MHEVVRLLIERMMDDMLEKGEIAEVLYFLEGKMSLTSRKDFYRGYLVGGLMASGVALSTFIPVLAQVLDLEKLPRVSVKRAMSDEDKHTIREMISQRLPAVRERIERELGK